MDSPKVQYRMNLRVILLAFLQAVSRVLPFDGTSRLKGWLPFGGGSRDTDQSPSDESPDSHTTWNPARILWQKWLDVSFIVNVTFGALVVLVFVGVIGGTVVMDTEQALTQQTESDLRHSSNLQHGQTDLWVSSMERQTELISNSRVVTTRSDAEIKQYIDTQQENLPGEVVAIHYIRVGRSVNASIVESTAPESILSGDELENSPWRLLTARDFQDEGDVLKTEPYQYPVEDDAYTDNTPVIGFVTQSHGNSNRAIMIVVDLREASQQLNAPPQGRSFAVDHDGRIILSTTPQDIGKDAYEIGYITEELWMQAHQETSSYTTTYYDSKTRIEETTYVTSMAHTDQANWVAYTQVPRASAFALRNNIQNSMLFLIGGVLISGVLVAVFIGFPTIQGLRKLSRTTQRVSDGNYDDPITSNRKDEIGQVFNDVDDMRLSLRDRINEVEDLNVKLQRIVHEQSEVMASVANGDLTQEMNTNTGLTALDELAKDFNSMLDDVRHMVVELEKSEEEMQEFMFIATHDLREPLRMIQTYADLLEVEYGDELDKESKEYLDFIVNSSNRIEDMIEDLYAYLRAKTHTNEYNDHDLNAIIDDVKLDLSDEIDTSNTDLIVGDLPTVHVDNRQFEEVFQNLIRNAIKYSKDNQDPEIKITGKSNDTSEEHIIRVTDNGIGIPQNQYEKIFEVFNRIERDDDDTGTGVGLAICKRIIEDHEGSIWVNSTEGEGTTFHIALPYEPKKMQNKFEINRNNYETTDVDFEDTI